MKPLLDVALYPMGRRRSHSLECLPISWLSQDSVAFFIAHFSKHSKSNIQILYMVLWFSWRCVNSTWENTTHIMSVRQDLHNMPLCVTENIIFVCSVKIQLWNRLVFCSKNSCILAQMLPVLVASGCLPSTGNRDQSHGQAVRMRSLLLCPALSISSLSGEGPHSSGATSQFNFHILFAFHILYSLEMIACFFTSQSGTEMC